MSTPHVLRRAALLALCAAACAPTRSRPREIPPRAPYALVLGTAQDGGLPQIGCDLPCCAAARRDPARRRLVSALCLVDPRAGKRFLFDATPDLPAQVELVRGHPAERALPGSRPPLFDGIFLTHAHMGHYTGLLFLGREAYGGGGLVIHASARMESFLRSNAPWSALLAGGAARIEALEPGRPVPLGPDLAVTPLAVPHRDELSDTLAFRIEGPERSLLFAPDTDGWERWSPGIEQVLSAVDLALLDGTFFDDGEVPGRDLTTIPHPFIRASLERFSALPRPERAKIRFTHLNHTNPACDPASAASAALRAQGMAVAGEGEILRL